MITERLCQIKSIDTTYSTFYEVMFYQTNFLPVHVNLGYVMFISVYSSLIFLLNWDIVRHVRVINTQVLEGNGSLKYCCLIIDLSVDTNVYGI